MYPGCVGTQAVQKKSFIAVVVEDKDVFWKAADPVVVYRIVLLVAFIQYESTLAYIKLLSDTNNQTNILFIALSIYSNFSLLSQPFY